MSDSSAASLLTVELINTSAWMYASNPVTNAPLPPYPDGLVPLLDSNGQPVTEKIDGDGFYAAAFVTPGNQVVVGFEGTSPDQIEAGTTFGYAQVAADTLIYLGANPPAYTDALDFTNAVLKDVAGQPSTTVLVTGHSLGAGEAEYVASQTGLGGIAFAPPGLPAADLGKHDGANLTDYVHRGDPVANYAYDTGMLDNFLVNDGIAHYGQTDIIGSYGDDIPLYTANGLLGGDTEDKIAGLGILAAAFATYHPLINYANALDIPLTSPSPTFGAATALLTFENITGLHPGTIAQTYQAITMSGTEDVDSSTRHLIGLASLSANAAVLTDLVPLQSVASGATPVATPQPATMPIASLTPQAAMLTPIPGESTGLALQALVSMHQV